MKAKFRVSSPEQSERLQKKLFEMGCEWFVGGQTIQFTNHPYLVINTGRITFSASSEYFERHHYPELDTERFIAGDYEWDGSQWLLLCRPIDATPTDTDTPSHYTMPITPLEYIEANGLDFCEGNIVKYVSRYKMKGGKDDLLKARTYLDKLIERYD